MISILSQSFSSIKGLRLCHRLIGELENETSKELNDLVLLGRERSVLREVGRSFEVCLDLLKVLSERGLHRQHHRLEVRDLLLLRVQGARGEPKRPADIGVSRREKAHLKGSSCIGTPSVVPPCEAVGAWGASSSSEAAGAWGAAPVLPSNLFKRQD